MTLKKENFSELKVCQSAAGYYIGRMYYDDEFGYWEPGSRESDYFKTKEEAQLTLEQGFEIRDCAENNYGYAQGYLPKPF